MEWWPDTVQHSDTFNADMVWKHTGLGAGTGDLGMIAFGTVAGGAGAALTGGNFWQGAVTGLVVSGLNHGFHSENGPGDPPTKEEQEQEYWRKYNEERLLPLNKGLIDFAFIADGVAGLSEMFAFKMPTWAGIKGLFSFGSENVMLEGKLANHLFKGTGKLADTPANRALITKISNGQV